MYYPVLDQNHYMCMNQPSIRLNKVHNISVRVYVCTHSVIYLMYWYVYFNLFQDLILWLWPWNQYLHLWSTTFNQLCPCLLPTMHCLWLDTCKQSSSSLSLSFLALCVALLWEVTGHSSLRLATGHHPTAFTLVLWPPFIGVLPQLSPSCSCPRQAAIWLSFMKNKVHSWRRRNERSTCKTNAKAA